MGFAPNIPSLRPAAVITEHEKVAPDRARGIAAVRRLRIAAIAASVAGVVWIGAAILTAHHGLDTSDEGFYLLSYRWWSTNLRTFTGVQYVYGPVFQALGYDIAALRLFRLLTVVSTHLVFGWAFMGWLRQRRPDAPASRWWEISGIAVIVACGGMVYSWVPLTPGYNDVSLLGGLLAASVVLRMATAARRGAPVPFWVPAALGPVAVAMLLAKWASAVLTLGLVAVTCAFVLAPRGRRELARVSAWALGGALLTVGLIQVFVIPLTKAVPQMLATTQLVAAKTNSPLALLDMYGATAAHLIVAIVRHHAVLLFAAGFAAMARGRVARRFAAAFTVAGLVASGWQLVAAGELHGGNGHLDRFPIAVGGVLVVAVIIGAGVVLRSRIDGAAMPSLGREGSHGWPVLAMLALLPAAQAAGTGTAIYFLAVDAFAAWAAIILAVMTGIETAPKTARRLAAGLTAGAVFLSASIATDSLWSHPYRTVDRARATASAAGVPALASLELDPRKAQGYSQLHRLLLPYIEPAGRAMMGFDEIAGIVLLLDGRPVGEAWYSRSDHARTAAGIRSQCRNGRGWWGSREPILLFRRPPLASDIGALRSCGLIFATGYRLLAPAATTMGLRVYVPTTDAAGRK